jgi:hypothetical protein
MSNRHFPDWVYDSIDKIIDSTEDSQYGEALRAILQKEGYYATISMVAGGAPSLITYPTLQQKGNVKTQTYVLTGQNGVNYYQGWVGSQITQGFALKFKPQNMTIMAGHYGMGVGDKSGDFLYTGPNWKGITLTIEPGTLRIITRVSNNGSESYVYTGVNYVNQLLEIRIHNITDTQAHVYIDGSLISSPTIPSLSQVYVTAYSESNYLTNPGQFNIELFS